MAFHPFSGMALVVVVWLVALPSRFLGHDLLLVDQESCLLEVVVDFDDHVPELLHFPFPATVDDIRRRFVQSDYVVVCDPTPAKVVFDVVLTFLCDELVYVHAEERVWSIGACHTASPLMEVPTTARPQFGQNFDVLTGAFVSESLSFTGMNPPHSEHT